MGFELSEINEATCGFSSWQNKINKPSIVFHWKSLFQLTADASTHIWTLDSLDILIIKMVKVAPILKSVQKCLKVHEKLQEWFLAIY